MLCLISDCAHLQRSLKWIVETVAGKNGRIRVVVIKTASGQYKLVISEIVILSIVPVRQSKGRQQLRSRGLSEASGEF